MLSTTSRVSYDFCMFFLQLTESNWHQVFFSNTFNLLYIKKYFFNILINK